MSRRGIYVGLLALSVAVATSADAQNCGWSRVDHRIAYDASGAWNPDVYRGIVDTLTIAQAGGALWEGSDSRLGKTMWQAIDAQLISVIGATVGSRIFTRVRPKVEDNPCLWFQGGSNYSFPSGEAAFSTALVVPYVLEYGHDYPTTYALLLLPVYVGAGRIKNQAHWQTDVLAGWAVGGVSGWYAHSQNIPILIQVLPHGFAVGLRAQF